MTTQGKVRVSVRSTRVPIRTIQVDRPLYSQSGLLIGNRISHVVLYGDTLSESQRRAIKQAKRISCNLDFALEIVDSAKAGLLRRLMATFLSEPNEPSLDLTLPADSDSLESMTETLGATRS